MRKLLLINKKVLNSIDQDQIAEKLVESYTNKNDDEPDQKYSA